MRHTEQYNDLFTDPAELEKIGKYRWQSWTSKKNPAKCHHERRMNLRMPQLPERTESSDREVIKVANQTKADRAKIFMPFDAVKGP